MAIKLGDVLVQAGSITQEQLEYAIKVQAQDETRRRLGEILQDLGYITEIDMLKALSVRVGTPLVDMSRLSVDPEAIGLIPRAVAEENTILPYAFSDDKIEIVINDPLNFVGINKVRELTGLYPVVSIAERQKIENAIDIHYADYQARGFIIEANKNISSLIPEKDDVTEVEGDEAMVVKLVNSLLIRGNTINTSDIHIEPYEKRTRIRMRLDGALTDYADLEPQIHSNIVARIKIMSRLDIAEKRIPQDGHFRVVLDNEVINARVSTMPMIYGEKVVIRYLNTRAEITNPSTFGMKEHHYRMVREMMNSPHGIIYVTGPTGSGKTTTLYLILEELLKRSLNISTIEDPVERNIYGLNQIQVNPVAGLTFATGLRSLLRQDPDIIMVGETRDSETASISVRAAITGHLVLSTLHTNDAISSIVRLVDMGVERYLLSSAVVGIIAQRLVRKICPECKREYTPTHQEKILMEGRKIGKVYEGAGCKTCNNTGYLGRVAIHEVVMMDSEIRDMVTTEFGESDMIKYLRESQYYQTLEESARELLNDGVTSMEEYLKVQYSII